MFARNCLDLPQFRKITRGTDDGDGFVCFIEHRLNRHQQRAIQASRRDLDRDAATVLRSPAQQRSCPSSSLVRRMSQHLRPSSMRGWTASIAAPARFTRFSSPSRSKIKMPSDIASKVVSHSVFPRAPFRTTRPARYRLRVVLPVLQPGPIRPRSSVELDPFGECTKHHGTGL